MLHPKRTGVARLTARGDGRVQVEVDGYVRYCGYDIEHAKSLVTSTNSSKSIAAESQARGLVRALRALS